MSRLTKRMQTEGGIPFVDVEDTQEALELLAQYEDIGSLEEFAEYKKAKADGRLVILPCKIGDKMWYWYGYDDEYGIDCFEVCGLNLREDGWYVTDRDKNVDKIGSQGAMLTREEAEKALESEGRQ